MAKAGKKTGVSGLGIPTGLTFDDVLIVPAASSVLPSEADLRTSLTKKLPLNIPLLSAAMDTVTEAATAIVLAREGGIGVIHRNMPAEKQAEEVRKVKRAEFWVVTNPLTVSPETMLSELWQLKQKHAISSFPVVSNGRLAGIITNRDMLFETNPNKKASEIMTRDLVVTDKFPSLEQAKEILHKNKIEKLPIVDRLGTLKGLVTVTDIESREKHPNANKDKDGRLRVAAAVGPRDFERVKCLVENEVDAIVVDTAHGHSKNVIDGVRAIKKAFDVEVIAGNVATASATEALISAGADAVKVGVGPGAICTTRVISGVGVPQVTAIQECSTAASRNGIPVISDGGVKYSGDITKAIAAGASSVMIGSLFAGCEETPGKIVFMHNRKFKQYRGMGSLGAMRSGSAERYFQKAQTDRFVPEGIEGVVPYKGTIAEIAFQLLGGLRSGMGYAGARTIEELRTKSRLIKITEAGYRESHPHDITITEEAPNYSQQ